MSKIVEALRELVACCTEPAGWTTDMLADRDRFNAMFARINDRLESAIDAARAALAEHDAQPAPAAPQDALDAKRLDWIECNVMNGNLEIAQSIYKTGYEFGFWQQEGPRAIVKNGTLRVAIDSAMKEKP